MTDSFRYVLHERQHADACVDCIKRVMGDLGTIYEVIIQEHDPKRSTEQNRLYWALLQEIARQAKDDDGRQHSPEWWAYKLRCDFGYSDSTIELRAGNISIEVPYPKSTTKMGKREFSELYGQIEAWAAEREIYLQ